ncbi:MAG: anti-phage-associated DUF1156 domain-containing protein [Clostridium sp.]|nr:anti-phage-associated DUF1156 domain-containing protein [Clostridium sp.]
MGYEKSFIEVQFPVSKVSKESYKERKAGSNQTLTGLGKWWGRKPLILVRAALLGALMPASDNPKKDMDIFLKILSMDEEGLKLRKNKPISIKDLFLMCNDKEKETYFQKVDDEFIPKYKSGLTVKQKEKFQLNIFDRLSYDDKLKYSLRPEEIDDKKLNWKEINEHLNTDSTNIRDLIKELGIRKFGEVPKVGDCFCGGGSIPFEAARIGCDVYASDLNPIAGLLTWADLNILSKSDEEVKELREFQERVYDEVSKQVEEWGIEKNEKGWRAKYYLYCNEVVCPECGCKVPLVANWVISESLNIIAKIKYNKENNNFDILIESDVSKSELKKVNENATIVKGSLKCPNCNNSTDITVLRRDIKNHDTTSYGVRLWNNEDFIPRRDDIFQERLYAIIYCEDINCITKYHYVSPSADDIKNEERVIELLSNRSNKWKKKGYIPNTIIEEGYNTTQVIRERGWKYWHQLFNPRQLLLHGLISENIDKLSTNKYELVVGLLGLNRCCDWNSKLSRWNKARNLSQDTFYNQALNTLYNYGIRSITSLKENTWCLSLKNNNIKNNNNIIIKDARDIKYKSDIWITDPPYADAVNYHELTEFFLAWDKTFLERAFPEWYVDSKRVLAVKGVGKEFNDSMIEIYSNLANHMSDNGMQIVMFTHQDVKVWAELAMILWSSGLRVTAAWNIATETESSGLKDGNYIKGTVLLVLRKQISEETAYLDELYPEIEEEVKNQIDSMRELDDKEDPNFSDPDYLLAAYAASLKVLTSYKSIEDIDVKYELSKNRSDKEETPIQKIINEAKKIAYDYLIPADFDNYLWKELKPVERFYLKGLEFEMNNMCKLSGYQELAKGFGVNEYNWMLGSTKANSARVKTPKEFAMRNINDNSVFGQSLVRHALASIYIALKEDNSSKGLNWLKAEVTDYWNNRNILVEILNYLSKAEVIDSMEHWKECAHEAFILKNLVENDSI